MSKINIQQLVQQTMALQSDPQGLATLALIAEVAEERIRQVKKGYTRESDDKRDPGVLAAAGAAYAWHASFMRAMGSPMSEQTAKDYGVDTFFNWSKPPKPARKALIQAAALIFAELEKMERE